MESERRKHKRLVSRFPVHFLNINKDQNEQNSLLVMFQQSGIAVNISNGGMLFLTSNNVKSGDTIKVDITLPFEKENKKISLLANVKWIRAKSENEFTGSFYTDFDFCCGIEFIESANKVIIKEFIEYWEKIVSKKKNKGS